MPLLELHNTSELPPTQDPTKAYEQRVQDMLAHPEGAALLLVDLQNDFLSPEGKSAKLWNFDISPMVAILPKIAEVTELFYQQGLPVIRTMTYEDPELRTSPGIDRYAMFEGAEYEEGIACLRGSVGAQLFVPARPGDIIIEKATLSAYNGTNLADIIKAKNLKTLFVAGVKTQRCVFHTVADLYHRDQNLAHVSVIEDCVASDKIDRHDSFLSELKEFYPPVIHSSQLINAWKKS